MYMSMGTHNDKAIGSTLYIVIIVCCYSKFLIALTAHVQWCITLYYNIRLWYIVKLYYIMLVI